MDLYKTRENNRGEWAGGGGAKIRRYKYIFRIVLHCICGHMICGTFDIDTEMQAFTIHDRLALGDAGGSSQIILAVKMMSIC